MLTAKQEKYCLNVAKGMTYIDAYKDAYNTENMKDDVIYVKASELNKNGKISVRIEELRSKAEDEAIMSAIERKKWLTKVINGEVTHTSYDSNGKAYENEAYISDKLKALDTLNKMDGEYTTKIEADIQTEIIVEFDDYDDEDQEV